MSHFMVNALLAGGGVALLAGMLGNFVVWRRMAYMGDAMSHAALLGVVGGMLLGLMTPLAVLAVAILLGVLLSMAQQDRRIPFDALLVVVSTGGLSAGLVLYGLLPSRQVDLYSYLFGDVLAVSQQDLLLIFATFAVQALLIHKLWRPLLRMTVHEEIARVEGVNVGQLQMLMTVLIAVTVAMALQVVGMLLTTALLVIPAVTARFFAHHPVAMLRGSMLAGVASTTAGVFASFHFNTPTGPTMVLCAVGIFLLAMFMKRR